MVNPFTKPNQSSAYSDGAALIAKIEQQKRQSIPRKSSGGVIGRNYGGSSQGEPQSGSAVKLERGDLNPEKVVVEEEVSKKSPRSTIQNIQPLSPTSNVPVTLYETTYKEPTEVGVGGVATSEIRTREAIVTPEGEIKEGEIKSRLATKQEADAYMKQERQQAFITYQEERKDQKPRSTASIKFEEFKGGAKNIYVEAEKRAATSLKNYGLSDENIKRASSQALVVTSPAFAIDKYIGTGKALDIGTEFISAPLKDVRDRPFTNVLVYGSGAAAGGVVKGVGIGAFKAESFAVKTTGKTFGIQTGAKYSVRTAEIGVGGYATFDIGKKVVSSKDEKELARNIALTGKDIGLIGAGFIKGGKAVSKVQDLFVKGIELPKESVIDPGFFKGQKYPQIKKGQTAGSLRQEFYEPVLPGETRGTPRAFTASPKDFPSITKTQPGTSEVPGLFGAPKISPTFLKVTTKEKVKLFGFSDITPSTPTVIRLKLKSAELAPGIKDTTSKPTGRYQEEFFEDIRGTGRSAIPLAKAEKEIVTAADTPIRQTKQDFFFEFGGRKVRIKEFEIIDNKIPSSKIKPGDTTLRKASTSSYSKGSSSILSPTSLGITNYFSSRKKSSLRSPISKSISKGIGSSPLPLSKPIRPLGSSKSRSLSSTSLSSIGLSSSSYIKFSPPGKGIATVPKLDLGKKSKISKKKSKPKVREDILYTPDFTSRTLGITQKIKRKDIKKLKGDRISDISLRKIPIIR